ncbi:secretory component protein-like protein shr3 [Tothia fuscella]|uniref:Secretory component protein-like protein shr3 n=1 Tax=Tothia fuscella TaxID=1048955 RepID=A0A9P4U2M7_9PEZI|nr:secretory component protein-like protein shr3 [Tothia fuscella]
MPAKINPFATFLIIGPTCFFLGILFILLPYDYHVLWTTPADREPYFQLQEAHLRFLHASPPLISRILHIAIGTGLLGFVFKLYKPSEANLLFDGASLVLYMCGITVYLANIVKGLRVVTAGIYGAVELVQGEGIAGVGGVGIGGEVGTGGRTGQTPEESEIIGREDSLRVLAASNTILALVLIGVLVLQAGQWYAQKKEEAEIEEMNQRDEVKRLQQGKKKA